MTVALEEVLEFEIGCIREPVPQPERPLFPARTSSSATVEPQGRDVEAASFVRGRTDGETVPRASMIALDISGGWA